MNNYIEIKDLSSVASAVKEAIALKSNPYKYKKLGTHKTLVMLFFT